MATEETHESAEDSKEIAYYSYHEGDTEEALKNRIAALKKPEVWDEVKSDRHIFIFLLIVCIPALLLYLGGIWVYNKVKQYQTDKINAGRLAEAKTLETKWEKEKFDNFDSGEEKESYKLISDKLQDESKNLGTAPLIGDGPEEGEEPISQADRQREVKPSAPEETDLNHRISI